MRTLKIFKKDIILFDKYGIYIVFPWQDFNRDVRVYVDNHEMKAYERRTK